jgi:glycosyltransferase involved in cell wall biosynthesis
MNYQSQILYLHPASAFGGASKSLIELYNCLKRMDVKGEIITPKGASSQAFIKAGMKVNTIQGLSQLDNTRYGYYRQLRWIILLREIFYFPQSIYALLKLRKHNFDLIHINEITLLPLGILAKFILKLPMIVHVRSVQRTSGYGWRTRLISYWLHCYADAVIAIDETVAESLPKGLPISVIHNGIQLNGYKSYNSTKTLENDQSTLVGFLGVLIPLKGIYELVEAMRILKQRRVPVKCLIAGENARTLSRFTEWIFRKLGFSQNVRSDLEKLIVDYGLQDVVELAGFVSDVGSIYHRLDILCFPSHLNAAGRPVFEAAFFGVPSIVAISNPKSDALLHEVTGLAIPKPDPVLIADAIQLLVSDKNLRKQMGTKAIDWAIENYSIQNSAAAVYKIYQQLIDNRNR